MEKQHVKRKNNHLLFYILLLAWPVLQFCVMYIGVNFNTVLLAFKRYDAVTGSSEFVWFDNFKTVFYNIEHLPVYSYAIKNSLIAFLCSQIVGMSLGLLFSYYIYKKRLFSGFFRVMLFTPSIITPIILVSLYRIFANTGLTDIINNAFKAGNLGLLQDDRTAFIMVLLYYIWFGFGTSSLLYVGAMGGISESVVEAAQMDGARPMREFVSIILPQIYSTIIVFITVGVAGIFTNQINLFSFYGESAAPSVNTVGYYLYIQVLSGDIGAYSEVSAMGILITVITAPVVLLIRYILNKINPMEN